VAGNLAHISSDEPWRAFEGRVVGGKFTLQRWLGSSGHSAVFLTEKDGRQAAIKLVPSDPFQAQRQLDLWRTATQLRHRHLLRILDMGRTQLSGSLFLFLVMEYAEEDISQILPERALTSAEVEELLPELLDALSYLHQQGFAHGHVKPSNVHAIGNEPKLSPDQLTLLAEPSAIRKRRDVYDAPEAQAGILSPASDLWSLGATLSAALTQRAPAYEANAERDLRPADEIPEPFRSIIRDCLRHNPKQRCSIKDIEAKLQPPARSVAAMESPVTGRPGRSRMLTSAVALALVLSAVGLAYSCGRHRDASPVATQETATAAPAAPAATNRTTQPETSRTETGKSNSADAAAATPPSASSKPVPSAPATAAPKASSTQGDIAQKVMPTVSAGARSTITGTVRINVRVDVDLSGKVTHAKLASPERSKYFAGLALKASQQWEFSPPTVDGQATSSTWMLRYSFTRKSTQVVPEQIQR